MAAELTPKQKAFADYYIETGNAAEAARRAGYKPKNARQIGASNLSKVYIAAYIKERLAEIDAARVATADEVIRFYTSVMRGEVKDQFGLDAQLADRLNAGKELMKRFERLENKETEDALNKAREILDGAPSVIE